MTHSYRDGARVAEPDEAAEIAVEVSRDRAPGVSRQAIHGWTARAPGQDALTREKRYPRRQGAASLRSRCTKASAAAPHLNRVGLSHEQPAHFPGPGRNPLARP